MIKTLKKRFVFSCMLAITILLVSVLGGINAVNIYSVSKYNDTLLYSLVENEIHFSKGLPLPYKESNISRNQQLSAIYFIVRESDYGIVQQIELERIASVDEQKAIELYQSVRDSNRLSGKIDHYKYQVIQTNNGASYIFLNLEQQSRDIVRIIILSLFWGCIAWIFMFFIVLFISKKAIAPIINNMEKQKQFITDAGHEIKTPLAIIKINTEALELHTKETKWSKNILNQVDRLTDLTQNLLTLAKLDEEVELKMELLDLSSLIQNKYNDFIEVSQNQHINMVMNVNPNIKINANEKYLTILLSIFFDNAMKYTNENGVFSIKCSQDKSVHLMFENTCDHLEEIEVENLVNRFYQNDQSHSSKGFGIGLSAAQSIVDIHKGKLTITKDEKMIHFEIEFLKI